MHLDLQKKGISTDTRSVQENFNLITSFNQDSADIVQKPALNIKLEKQFRSTPSTEKV